MPSYIDGDGKALATWQDIERRKTLLRIQHAQHKDSRVPPPPLSEMDHQRLVRLNRAKKIAVIPGMIQVIRPGAVYSVQSQKRSIHEHCYIIHLHKDRRCTCSDSVNHPQTCKHTQAAELFRDARADIDSWMQSHPKVTEKALIEWLEKQANTPLDEDRRTKASIWLAVLASGPTIDNPLDDEARIDICRNLNYGNWTKKVWLTGWTAGSQPAVVEAIPETTNIQEIAGQYYDKGWTVRQFGNCCWRLWRDGIQPIRTKAQIIRIRKEINDCVGANVPGWARTQGITRKQLEKCDLAIAYCREV